MASPQYGILYESLYLFQLSLTSNVLSKIKINDTARLLTIHVECAFQKGAIADNSGFCWWIRGVLYTDQA